MIEENIINEEKEEKLEKSIGLFGSIALICNNTTGPAMMGLPHLMQVYFAAVVINSHYFSVYFALISFLYLVTILSLNLLTYLYSIPLFAYYLACWNNSDSFMHSNSMYMYIT